ncbi:hypothetical protein LPJ77_006295, partial [Coemansia sp. RSA 2523]
MPKFIVYFAQLHEDFRLPELDALSKLENVRVEYDPHSYIRSSPFLVVEISSSEQAAKLVRRAILIRSIIEYWGSGRTYSDVYSEVKHEQERWALYKTSSFKFTVDAFGKSLTQEEKVRVINGFSFLEFTGPIRMRNAQAEFFVCEEYDETRDPKIWFGRVVGTGSRDLIDRFDVKKRKYLGNTTMDAELSLLMANQAQAQNGMFVYDPFVGTGSFLLT